MSSGNYYHFNPNFGGLTRGIFYVNLYILVNRKVYKFSKSPPQGGFFVEEMVEWKYGGCSSAAERPAKGGKVGVVDFMVVLAQW